MITVFLLRVYKESKQSVKQIQLVYKKLSESRAKIMTLSSRTKITFRALLKHYKYIRNWNSYARLVSVLMFRK